MLEKNRTYHGRIIFAIGCYESGELNPTPLVCELEGLDDSPWFYDTLRDWLSDLPEKFRETGWVYEWTGSFRNYKFEGNLKCLLNPTA